jgi:hypothetical protein
MGASQVHFAPSFRFEDDFLFGLVHVKRIRGGMTRIVLELEGMIEQWLPVHVSDHLAAQILMGRTILRVDPQYWKACFSTIGQFRQKSIETSFANPTLL